MKASLILLAAFLGFASLLAVDTVSELNLTDGSKIKGKVMSATASEITVMSDFGILRIALDKLTPESRAKIAEGNKPDVDALLRRVSELEAKVAQLQQENESLRRQALTRVAPPAGLTPTTGTSGLGFMTPPSTSSTGAKYTMSSTGKRHNSRCRYFGGRPCGPSEGIACKVCGG